MKNLNCKIELFLLGFPYGLLAKVYEVEAGEGRYTLWDRLRYKLLVGEAVDK